MSHTPLIAEKYTLFCAIIVSSISDVRVLPWQMTCYTGVKHMAVTFHIGTEGVKPQFVELFPRGMTTGIGPVGIGFSFSWAHSHEPSI